MVTKKKKTIDHRKNTRGNPRRPLEVNEEFFRKAVKDGEIEIRVRSPPKGFNLESYQDSLERSAERVRRERNESQDFERTGSPAAKLKNDKVSARSPHKREHSDPRTMRHESLRGDNAKEALYNVPPEKKNEGDNEEVNRNRNKHRARSPQKNEDLTLHYDRNYVPLSAQKKDESHRNDAKVRESNKNTKEQKLSSGNKKNNEPLQQSEDSLYQTDIAEIFRQLRNITNQQSKIMESINNFQRVTQDDIAELQDRMIQVEEAIDNIQKDASDKQYNQQPYPFDARYGYMQQGQPIYYAPSPGMIPGYYPYANQSIPIQRTLSDSTLKQTGGKSGGESSSNQPSQKNPEEKSLPSQGLRQGASRETQKQSSSQSKKYHLSSPSEYQKRLVLDKEDKSISGRDEANLQGGSKKNENESIPRRLEPTVLESRDNSESPLRGKTRDEQDKSGINDTQNISLNQTITWERIDNFLAASLINDAFATCLREGDNVMLGRLVKKTGPVPEQLEPQTLESLAGAASGETINLEEVVALVPFVDKALEDRVKLSSQVYKGLKTNLSKALGAKKSLPEIDASILKIIENDLDIINGKLNQ